MQRAAGHKNKKSGPTYAEFEKKAVNLHSENYIKTLHNLRPRCMQ